MNGLNPNLVLRAIVLVVLAAVGAVLFIIGKGGPVSDQVVQAGLVTVLTTGVVTSLFALLQSTRARDSASSAHDAINGTQDDLEAAQTRIAYLEARLGIKPPPDPPAK